MVRNIPHHALRALILFAVGLSLSACVVAPDRPYYAVVWHPHPYYHGYYY